MAIKTKDCVVLCDYCPDGEVAVANVQTQRYVSVAELVEELPADWKGVWGSRGWKVQCPRCVALGRERPVR